MAWKDLTVAQRSQLMNLMRSNGVQSLSDMVRIYDSYHPSLNDTEQIIPYQAAPVYSSGGKIHIKPENRGKFTALKKRTGHSATWFKQHGTPAQKKMAVFALNSKHWSHKHEYGGYLLDKIYDLPEEQVMELIRQGYEVERV